MKAIRIHEYGAPNVMRLEEMPTPSPGAGEVLVRIAAASVNFIDVQKRRGELVGQAFYKQHEPAGPDLPTQLGSQGAGTIEALGPEVTGVQIGDRVCFWGSSYATHIVLSAKRLIRIPDELSFEHAAAGLNQGFLAYVFTHFTYAVKPGDWCMVQAAAGGLGLLICQMIKIRGGRLIGVTSTEEKAKHVREAGADEIIISKQAEISKEARRMTGGRGVNVIFDGVGKDTFEPNLDSLAPAGYLVIYGQSSGYVPPFDIMRLQEKGSLYLTRANALPWVKEYPSYLEQIVPWIRDGRISIRVAGSYSLEDAAAAHDAFEKRSVSGRLLLIP